LYIKIVYKKYIENLGILIKLKPFFSCQSKINSNPKQVLRMSSPVVVPVVVVPEVEVAKVVRPRKPTLPAKFQKVLVTGYHFLNILSELGLLNGDVKLAQDAVKMYSSIEDQTVFYEKFLVDFKSAQKEMKKLIVAHNKPPKAPRKPRAPKEPKEGETAEPKKVGRKKNTVKIVNDAKPDDIISQLVSIGTSEHGGAAAEPAPVKVPAKRGRKPKAAAAEAPVVQDTIPAPVVEEAAAPAVVPAAEKKPRKNAKKEAPAPVVAEVAAPAPVVAEKKPRKNAKKEAPAPVPEPAASQDEDDGDELVTREYVINGVQVLVDEDNNVYHFTTHEQIGTFDQANAAIVPL
jgi:hypothetical protein